MAQHKEMWSFSVSMICRNINIHSSDWAVNVLSQKSTLPPGNRNLLAFPVQGECLKYTALQQLDRLNTSTCDRADESLTPGMKERRDSFISQAGQQLHTANWLMAGFLPFFFSQADSLPLSQTLMSNHVHFRSQEKFKGWVGWRAPTLQASGCKRRLVSVIVHPQEPSKTGLVLTLTHFAENHHKS